MKTIMFRLEILVIISFAMIGCRHPDSDKTPIPLEPVEILEFNGQVLSPISEFQENSISGVQHVSEKTYRLKIDGLVQSPLEMSYDQVLGLAHYSKVVTLICVEKWQVTILWEGIRIEDLINLAGIKGNVVSVIFHAVDGYVVSMPLEYIRSHQLLLACKMNGLKLPENRGFPFQVVAESKLGYSWIKWVTEIELSTDTNYTGF
jgi:DMSO/TMAO reductase YedYZ molybdopterin-dependent catalytic subunit